MQRRQDVIPMFGGDDVAESILEALELGVCVCDLELEGWVYSNALAREQLPRLGPDAASGPRALLRGRPVDEGSFSAAVPFEGDDGKRYYVRAFKAHFGIVFTIAQAAARSADAVGRLSAASGLTPRETEILERLYSGLSNAEIAQATGIAEATVKHHVSSVFAKVGISSRAELLATLHGAKGERS